MSGQKRVAGQKAGQPKPTTPGGKPGGAGKAFELDAVWKKAVAGFGALVALMSGIAVFTAPFAKNGSTLIWSTVAVLAAGVLLTVLFLAVHTYRKHPITVTVGMVAFAAIVVVAALVGVAYASWHHVTVAVPLDPQTTSPPSPKQSSLAPTATATMPSPSSTTTARTYAEIADNHRGIPVFANDQGAASNAPSIPFGTPVQVLCWAPNDSGMSSINSFYLIADGTWAGTYASANTFANGDSLGGAGSTAIDPAVPKCSPSQIGQG